jgi:hypothetical protein
MSLETLNHTFDDKGSYLKEEQVNGKSLGSVQSQDRISVGIIPEKSNYFLQGRVHPRSKDCVVHGESVLADLVSEWF